MPGSTTELNLATAVDTDDNADYLTLSLANSLRTVDALFNSITGHNHGGAHQGGAIAPAAIPGGSITNAQLGPDVARANLLTNGGFEIWQRGNGPFSASGAYTSDRWNLGPGAGSSFIVNADSANTDGSARSAQVQYTHSASSSIAQRIEAAQFAGRTLSLSMRLKVAGANAVRLRIDNDSTGGGVPGAYHTGNFAYQTVTVTQAIPIGATAVYAVVLFDAACTAYLDNAMLVVGSQPADYAPLHPADDLARCFRYYETMGGTFADENIGLLWCYAASGGAFPLRWKVRKAVSPTMTINGLWRVQYGAGAFTAGSLGLGSASVDNANAAISGATGLTVGQVAAVSGQNPTTSFVTIEANP